VVAIQQRLNAFEDLIKLSGKRVDEGALGEARRLLDRVGERRRLSLDHTVVALAGATGSGKSSLFNAICGLDLSMVGARRPTTSAPVACVWDPRAAGDLLDRLGVPQRLRFARRSVLDTGRLSVEAELAGLILLDLPDHDSVDPRHRAEVDRLVELVDVVVWVLDPEKYADAAVHERYLRPMAGHADVMLVVLNQMDRLPEDAVPQCTDDLRRLLDEDGLAVGEHGEAGTQVLATSALTGEGVEELRETLGQVVRERGAANRRIRADLDRAASMLRPVYVGHGAAGLGEEAGERFLQRLGEAVGARAAGQAARRGYLRQAEDTCATPFSRYGGRLVRGLGDEPHPCDRSAAQRAAGRPSAGHLAAEQRAVGPRAVGRPSMTQRAVVDEAVRDLVEEATVGLPAPWAAAVRRTAERGGGELGHELDRAVAGGGAAAQRSAGPWWWRAVQVGQWLLAMAAVVGAAGFLADVGGLWNWSSWLSGVLLAGGVAGGTGLARLCADAAGEPARAHGDEVERRLREAAEDRGRALVLAPIEEELGRYRQVRERYGAAAED
jgi:GTP-binding protein EngB required for normal cell division